MTTRHDTDPPRPAVSARHVAEEAGVSRSAVSRTFTPGASVAPATRARVLAAAERLGYHVNHLARGLTGTSTGIVALIVSELETPFRAGVVAALTEGLQAAGKVAMVINTDGPGDGVERALRQAISYRTDAAILLSGRPDPALATLCARNGLRLVLINRDDDFPDALHIRLNDTDCGERAFAMLRDAGCRRVAVATSRSATASLRLRAEGFRDAARRAGVASDAVALGATSYAAGREIGDRLLGGQAPPDGIFCTTDLIACGVIDAARDRGGLRIPQDLRVIGFDDIPQAGWDAYRLTTFGQPIEGIVDACVAWLDQETAGPRTVELEARRVVRASCAGGGSVIPCR
ncbi:LacI family DNA-binding transcriptional regulator [Palleronia sediminis]|uniref:LacI family DNA-binding transcriptional regulator n=1 Tax=Palleronia sediminis TaxID=2547833 RepID=A0A4V3B984_9RHOB|nr:LacI family DNA-binding transcriptional regulator [Palleronia sediminis]TDL78269.1 LacI family DNA-binding transcriptional regulator [Palleronia sediminis]